MAGREAARRRRLVGALAPVTALCVVAAAAHGGIGSVSTHTVGNAHGLEYRVGSYGSYTTGDIVILASCPAGMAPIGGGADVSGPAGATRLTGSFPLAKFLIGHPDSWWAEAQSESGQQKTIADLVVCREAGYDGVTYVEDVADDVPVGVTRTVETRCPKRTNVVGGGLGSMSGFEGNLAASLPVDSSDRDKRPDDAWRVRARPDTITEDVVAVGVCLERGKAEVAYATARSSAGPHRAKTSSPSCPRRMSVSSGGAQMLGPAGSRFVRTLRFRDSKADGNHVPDDRWQSTVFNAGDTPAPMTARAICVR